MEYHSDLLKHHSYSLCKATYVEDINDIKYWLSQAATAKQCGTFTMTLNGCENYTDTIMVNLRYAIDFLSDPPQSVRKPIVWDEMPDLLTDEQMSEYFGWAIPTIQSKRSRGELPKIDGMALTPKKLLIEMFESLSVAHNDTARTEEDAIKTKVNSFKRK